MTGAALTKCTIYVSKKENGQWGEPVAVEGINGEGYSSKQPAFAKINGQNALFFVSDMAGGEGGWDIYYTVLKSPTSCEPAVSVGKNVNTIGDDETPFFKDDQLYFSSNGHASIGGYDIYVADQKGVKWDNVENLGKSINTEFDELYFVLDGSGYNGFIVSNRKGAQTLAEKQTFDKEDKWRTSGDDIFSVTFPKEVLADLDVRVFDQNDKPVKGATITLREVSKKEGQTQTNPRGNKFNFPLELDKQYEIVAASECYNGDKVVISTKDLKESKTFVTEFVLKMVAPTITKRTIKKTKTFSKGQPIVLKNLNFD
jgi:hypothetical protein